MGTLPGGKSAMQEKVRKFPLQLGKDLWRLRLPLFLAAIYLTCTGLGLGNVCIFQILTGFPCPGCGLTRAGILVLTGQWAQAARMNFSIYLWIFFLLYLLAARYFFPQLQRKLTGVLIVTCIFTIFYYTARMLLVFPDPPLVYETKNLLNVFSVSVQGSVLPLVH